MLKEKKMVHEGIEFIAKKWNQSRSMIDWDSSLENIDVCRIEETYWNEDRSYAFDR